MTPTEELLAALAAFNEWHRAAEQAYMRYSVLDAEMDRHKAELMATVCAETDEKGKPAYSNDASRKAEMTRRLGLNGNANLVNQLADAEADKRSADASLARAEQALKTHRSLINHYTAELTLEAARLQAAIAAEPVRPQPAPHNGRYVEPTLIKAAVLYGDDDLPF